MKAALLLLLAAAPASADLVVGHGQTELRLMPGPCVHVATMIRIHPDHRPRFKKLQATVGGKLLFGCWTALPEQDAAYVIFEGSPGFVVPMASLRDEPGA